MKRLLLIPALFGVLGACSCCSAPTSSEVHDINALLVEYSADVQVEANYAKLPWCSKAPAPCKTTQTKSKLTTANYNASSALFIADSERTDSAIQDAQASMKTFTDLIHALPVQQ